MSQFARECGLAGLAFARKTTLGFLEEIPEDKLLLRPVPGGNHAMWIAGHLAWTEDGVVTMLRSTASTLSKGWKELFAMQTTPLDDRKAYPSLSEVKDQLAAQRERLVALFRSLSDEQLQAPLPADMAGFAPNFCALMSSLAWHEGMHGGQLTVIRKALGFPPKFA